MATVGDFDEVAMEDGTAWTPPWMPNRERIHQKSVPRSPQVISKMSKDTIGETVFIPGDDEREIIAVRGLSPKRGISGKGKRKEGTELGENEEIVELNDGRIAIVTYKTPKKNVPKEWVKTTDKPVLENIDLRASQTESKYRVNPAYIDFGQMTTVARSDFETAAEFAKSNPNTNQTHGIKRDGMTTYWESMERYNRSGK